jgi:hypothetical protein
LEPHERPETLPSSTKSVPYECWIKGFLLNEQATIGDKVRIKTFIGRELSGSLCQVNPAYDHDFGRPQKELLTIGSEAWAELEDRQGK